MRVASQKFWLLALLGFAGIVGMFQATLAGLSVSWDARLLGTCALMLFTYGLLVFEFRFGSTPNRYHFGPLLIALYASASGFGFVYLLRSGRLLSEGNGWTDLITIMLLFGTAYYGAKIGLRRFRNSA